MPYALCEPISVRRKVALRATVCERPISALQLTRKKLRAVEGNVMQQESAHE